MAYNRYAPGLTDDPRERRSGVAQNRPGINSQNQQWQRGPAPQAPPGPLSQGGKGGTPSPGVGQTVGTPLAIHAGTKAVDAAGLSIPGPIDSFNRASNAWTAFESGGSSVQVTNALSGTTGTGTAAGGGLSSTLALGSAGVPAGLGGTGTIGIGSGATLAGGATTATAIPAGVVAGATGTVAAAAPVAATAAAAAAPVAAAAVPVATTVAATTTAATVGTAAMAAVPVVGWAAAAGLGIAYALGAFD